MISNHATGAIDSLSYFFPGERRDDATFGSKDARETRRPYTEREQHCAEPCAAGRHRHRKECTRGAERRRQAGSKGQIENEVRSHLQPESLLSKLKVTKTLAEAAIETAGIEAELHPEADGVEVRRSPRIACAPTG